MTADEPRGDDALLRTMGRMARLGGWSLDVATLAVRWTDETYRIHELPVGHGEALASALEFYHPDDRPKLVAAVQACLGRGEEYDLELRLLTARGREIWVRTMGAAESVAGRIVRLNGTIQDITERRHREDQLRHLNRRYALALQAGCFAVFKRNLTTGESQWDERGWEIVGRAPRPVGPTTEEVLAMLVPEDRSSYRDLLTRLAAGAEAGDVTVRFLRPDGAVRSVVIRAIAEHRAGVGDVLVTGLVEDVSGRLQAEEERRSALQRYNTILSTIAEGLVLLDATGRVVECNAAAARIFGLSREEFMQRRTGDPRWEVFGPDGGPFPLADLPGATALATGRPVRAREVGIRRADGSSLWVRSNADPLVGPDGRVTHVVVSFSDVTAQREAETERQQSAARLQAALVASRLAEERIRQGAEHLQLALSASRMGIWRHHPASGRAEWDARMRELYELAADAPVPPVAEWMERIHPEDRAAVGEALSRLGPAHPRFEFTFRLVRRDGSVRHVRAVGSLEAGRDQDEGWIAGINEDVTDRILAEQKRRSLEEQLLQVQKLETLGTLAGGVAHDFNNLLTGIIGFIELSLPHVPPGGDVASYLRHARSGGLRARELVKRLLLFARRAPVTTRVPVRLAELVAETIPLVSATLPATVVVHSVEHGELPLVRADAGQLQQVLMNLCLNAAQAIGAAHGRIEVALSVFEGAPEAPPAGPAGRWVRLAVTDDGCGMEEAVQARIFDPFFTTRAQGQGTGLGLSIVHGIVHDHGGFIRVRSAPGRGATFELYFPAAVEPATAPALVAPEAAGRPGGGRRVLIADDEEPIRTYLAALLRHEGYVVDACADGAAAVRQFAAQPEAYALACVDLSMPGQTGYEVIAALRQRRPELPVVLMSGDHERYGVAAAPEGRRVVRIGKPFTPTEVLAVVAAALADGPAAG